ncbi:GFA family protein [Teichococcus vastitatis]|uniref:GFA family protein n=1 Tax=Teichococcus vastitatis TaxID=2307076 RepID=A0ABS9W585_9PROT|nr:GFA family protein [Pseudoroseomonas vastitatis]MCI0754439.1 GFA family protein [Pseudoroseomonas vastitatis]
MLTGRCHCGAIHYAMPETEVLHHALCHCGDCRRHAGAPMVGWVMVPAQHLQVTGEPREYRSSEHGRRRFCAACGTGLFYVNEAMLPRMVDVQSGTLDDPAALPPGAQIQLAERLPWMDRLDALPGFERYPG